MPRDGVSKKLIGRNLAATLIALERVRLWPLEERRRVVQAALRRLAEDDAARASDDIFDEARKTLIDLMKK